MKLTVQPSGTHLSDEEYKALTALLVKMGYTVAIRKEKEIGRNLSKRVVYTEEEKKMRPYIFRGKREEDGKWVIGTGIDTFGGTFILNAYERETDATDCDDYRVNPLTVGQYTGLKDKNGNGIFEGDIVKTDKFNEPNKLYVITYDELMGAFIGDNENFYFTTFDGDSNLFEVIGNIHDNSELLGED